MSAIQSRPSSDRIVRERVFDVIRLRDDGKDAEAQLIVITKQLVDEKFTGSMTINFGQGGINSVHVKESRKV